MDEVIIHCPNCQQKISCPAEYEGQEFTCPTCGQSLMLTGVTAEQPPAENKASNEVQMEQASQVLAKAFQHFVAATNLPNSESADNDASQQAKKDTKKESKIPSPPQSSSVQDTVFFFAIGAYILGVILICAILLIAAAPDVDNKGDIVGKLGAACIGMFITGVLFSTIAEMLEHQRQSSFYTKKLYELMWKKEHKK